MNSMVTRAVTGATRRDVLAGGTGLYAAGLLSTPPLHSGVGRGRHAP